MAIYTDKFKGLRSEPTSDDLMDFARAIIDNVMRNLHVATLGIVTNVKTNEIYVKVIPNNENETEKEILVINGTSEELQKDDVVLVLFLDNDFRTNLEQIKANNTKNLQKNKNLEKHTEKFGIIINKLQI